LYQCVQGERKKKEEQKDKKEKNLSHKNLLVYINFLTEKIKLSRRKHLKIKRFIASKQKRGWSITIPFDI